MFKRSLIFVATLLMPAIAVAQTPAVAKTPVVAQTPKPIHISGPKAIQLIYLLESGSPPIHDLLTKGATHFVIPDLMIVSMFDLDLPDYRLTNTNASARVGEAKDSRTIGESAALFDFFTGPMKMVPDYGMSKSEITIASVSCKVVKAAAPVSGYECTLFEP
jgi:hypothetical protein